MKPRHLIIIGILAGLVGWLALFHNASPKEPSYQGRSLEDWISIGNSGYSGNSTQVTLAEKQASKAAIRAMGTNTFPVLIKWLQEDDLNWRSSAAEVFEILGEIGRPAAPALVQLMTNTNKNNQTRFHAFLCLEKIKPEKTIYVPALVQLVHDPDKDIRYYTALELTDVDPKAAKKAGVFDMFPQFRTFLESNDVENIKTNMNK